MSFVAGKIVYVLCLFGAVVQFLLSVQKLPRCIFIVTASCVFFFFFFFNHCLVFSNFLLLAFEKKKISSVCGMFFMFIIEMSMKF